MDKKYYIGLKIKVCQFPSCGIEFEGRGKTKYCPEHQKQEYKKFLYQRFESSGIGEANVEIENDNHEHFMIRECDLDGCDEKYVIQLIPGQKIYPRYCPLHRNKFKREFFTEQR